MSDSYHFRIDDTTKIVYEGGKTFIYYQDIIWDATVSSKIEIKNIESVIYALKEIKDIRSNEW